MMGTTVVLKLLQRPEKMEQGEGEGRQLYSGGRTGEELEACLHEQRHAAIGHAWHASGARQSLPADLTVARFK
jgi:hypothetical protein